MKQKKTTNLNIRLTQDEALLIISALRKAKRENCMVKTQTDLVIWLLNRYINERKL